MKPLADVPFEIVYAQWIPKLMKMGRNFVPYMDEDDVRQEMTMMLWKCSQFYETTDRRISFHTYIHRAMINRLQNLRRDVQRHNPEYGSLLYLSVLEAGEEDEDVTPHSFAEAMKELKEDVEDVSLDLFIDSAGLTVYERQWVLWKVEGYPDIFIRQELGLTYRRLLKISRSAKSKLKIQLGG